MQKARIKDIVIAVTYNCNSRCQMCNIWQKTDNINALGKDELLNLPENLENINISGGEPFLRADLPELIKAIKARCPKAKVIISTNGFATETVLSQMEKILKIMPEIGVAVSLDGLDGNYCIQGRMTPSVEALVKEKGPDNFEYYLCGGQIIVEALKQFVLGLGAQSPNIFFEKFT